MSKGVIWASEYNHIPQGPLWIRHCLYVHTGLDLDLVIHFIGVCRIPRVGDQIGIYAQHQYLFKKNKSLPMLKDRAK